MLQTLATHEAEVFAEAGASSPVVTPAAGAGGGGGGAAPPPMHMPSALTLTSAEDKKNLRIAAKWPSRAQTARARHSTPY
jgi:hypothetical protein